MSAQHCSTCDVSSPHLASCSLNIEEDITTESQTTEADDTNHVALPSLQAVKRIRLCNKQANVAQIIKGSLDIFQTSLESVHDTVAHIRSTTAAQQIPSKVGLQAYTNT